MTFRQTLLLLCLPLHVSAQMSGQLDSSFAGTGYVITNGTVDLEHGRSVLLQPDGRILVTGTAILNGNDVGVARFLPNGQLDPSFGNSGSTAIDVENIEFAYGSALQSDGRILIAGMTHLDTTFKGVLLRLDTNGLLDQTFGIAGVHKLYFPGETAYLLDCAIQPNGKTVACGFVGNDLLLHRVDPDGTPDPTFGTFGTVRVQHNGIPTSGESVLVLPNGQILVCGRGSSVARFNSDGTLDTVGFGTAGWADLPSDVTAHTFSDLVLQPDGRILVAGGPSIPPDTLLVVRFLANGVPDTTFAGDGSSKLPVLDESSATALALRIDGKIITVGSVVDQGISSMLLSRFNENGQLDPSFGLFGTVILSLPLPPPHLEYGSDVVIQPDGSIIAVASHFSGTDGFLAARFLDPFIPLGLASFAAPKTLHAYPVPTHGELTLECSFCDNGPVGLTIFDNSGRLVLNEKRIVLYGSTALVDLTNIARGTYVLEITCGAERATNWVVLY